MVIRCSIESVTGSAVDNTDPDNPVINSQNLSGYVPYTGATADVDLGAFNHSSARKYTGLGTALLPAYSFTGDTNTGMWSPAADTLAFSEGGVEVMRINSSGNIGINTFLPLARVHAISTSDQLRLGYDDSNFIRFTTGSTGITTITTTGTATTTGLVLPNIGIGTNPSANSTITVNRSFTTPMTANNAGIDVTSTYTPTSNETTFTSRAGSFNSIKAGSFNSLDVRGFQAQAQNSGTGNITNLYGFLAGVTTVNTGVVTNGYGAYIVSPNASAANVMTNVFGLYIQTQARTGISTAYGIFQQGASDLNYFAGNIGINTTPNSIYNLDAVGSTRSGFRFTSGTRVLAFSNFAADVNYLDAAGGAFRIRTTDSNGIEFWPNNTRAASLGAGGNAHFGTPNTISTGYQLSVQPTVASNQGLVVRGAAAQTANLQEWQDNAGTVNGIIDKDGYVRRGNSIIFNQNTILSGSAGAFTELGTILTASLSRSATIEVCTSWYVGANADARYYTYSAGYDTVSGWRTLAPAKESSSYANPIELEVSTTSGQPKFRLRRLTTTGATTIWVTIKITHDTLGTASRSLTNIWAASATTGIDTAARVYHKNNVLRQRDHAVQIQNDQTNTFARIENADSASDETGLNAKGISIYTTGELRADGVIGNAGTRIFDLGVVSVPNTVNDFNEFATVTTPNFTANVELWATVRQSGYAISKKYIIPLSYAGTGGAWQKCIPIASTGAYAGNDQDIEVNIAAGTATFRVRRVSGSTTSGALYTSILVGGGADSATVTATNVTGSTTAPTAVYTPTTLCRINGRTGIGGLNAENPTALLHLGAGTASANSAPLKLTSGTNMSTPENGAFEFDGTNLYFTVGGVRKTVTLV